MNAECFTIQPVSFALTYLRRYGGECPEGPNAYHDARFTLGRADCQVDLAGCFQIDTPEIPDDDPRWPRRCSCGYVFTDEDTRQVFTEPVWMGGEGWSGPLRCAPAGAVWEAPWHGDHHRVNGDGPVLVIRLPNGGDWTPGMGASNCTRKGEDHDCWCVHGISPKLTIDKTPEPGRSTCNAGAGSIDSRAGDGWHGFLRNGVLEEC